jgi:hypothetical protein
MDPLGTRARGTRHPVFVVSGNYTRSFHGDRIG